MSTSVATAPGQARYTTGSTLRHVLVLAATGSIGLVSIFIVDFANLFYISLLGDQSLTAAVGYAAVIVFFYISAALGLMIAATALVSRALGAGDKPLARRMAGSAIAWMVVVTGGATLVTLPFLDGLLTLFGAAGKTREVAWLFLLIVMPTTPLVALGMCFSGLLRAVGDPKRAMYTTLIYGGVTAALDPLLIFFLGLGVTGAAIVAVIARVLMVAYSLTVLVRRHDAIAMPSARTALGDLGPIAAIGVPAILTNVATPVGSGFVTAAIAAYGDSAVAGWAVVSRLIPVAFGGLFALSGAVGPVLGQNFGAKAFDRVRSAMGESLAISAIYVLAVSAILFLARDRIVAGFGAEGEAARLIVLFCEYLAITFVAGGALFVANAAFNNLGYPKLSTILNWGRATVGTLPFIWVGGRFYGADGVLAGFMIGAVPFGLAAVFFAYRIIAGLGAPEGGRRGLSGFFAAVASRRPSAG